MAPPGKRRTTGHSRRAQYGLFLGYVFSILGLLVALLMLVLSGVDPRRFDAIRGAALDVTAPVSSAGRGVVDFFVGIGDAIGDYWQAGSQNEALQAELAQTRRELVTARAAEAENRRLLRLLGLAIETPDEIVTTRIVGSSFESSRRMATLAAGSSSGVAVGQPVRAPDGLIGRVIETGRWASRVLLITDGASNVPVRLLRDGTPAIAGGRGDGTIELRTLEVGQNPFRPGDILVTSGTGGIFPPNIPVAQVIRLEGDTAIARPLANPARADFALVLRPYQPAASAPLDQAAPPSAGPPVAAPTPSANAQSAPSAGARQNDPRYQPALQSPSPQGGAR